MEIVDYRIIRCNDEKIVNADSRPDGAIGVLFVYDTEVCIAEYVINFLEVDH